MNVEDLIKKGPSNPKEIADNSKIQMMSDEAMFSNDESHDKAVNVDDLFEKRRQGIDPEMEKTLKEEEAQADDEDKQKTTEEESKSVKENVSKEKETEDDKNLRNKETKPVDKSSTKKSEDKSEEDKSSDSSESLVHLELGISPGTLGHFKNMNKAAREWITSELKTRYKKINELSAKVKEAESKVSTQSVEGNNLPSSWYEHPQAVTLLPEYQDVAGTYNKAQGLIEHYEKQLIAIAEGEAWQDPQVDSKGNIVYQTYEKPDSRHTLYVNKKLAELRDVSSELKRRAVTIKTNYETNSINTRQKAEALENQYFPQYSDPEVLKSNEHFIAIDATLNKFGLGNDRMSGVLKKMYVYTMETLAEKEKFEKQLQEGGTTNVKKEEKKPIRKNGPTGDAINHGDTKKKVYDNPEDEPVDMDELEKLIQNRR